jgi:glycosyltransferase involved in cell wall biosynthesis
MTSMRPKITVALLTYNRSKYLPDAIDSVLAQTFREFTLIILDNASTDNTQDIVRSYSDHRIVYIRNETNIGAFNNGLKAFSLADSEFLLIFHDDDIMKPKLLEYELSIMYNFKDVVIVASNVELIDKEGSIISHNGLNIFNDIIFNQYDFIKSFYLHGLYLPTPTVMLRMTYFRNNIRLNKEVGPAVDSYFYFETNLHSKLYLLSTPLLKNRVHEEQDSIINKYYMNLSLNRYTYRLLENNNLVNLYPYLKKKATYSLISCLIENRSFNIINKTTFAKELFDLKNEIFFCMDTAKVSDKIINIFVNLMISISYHFPLITRYFYKIKKSSIYKALKSIFFKYVFI